MKWEIEEWSEMKSQERKYNEVYFLSIQFSAFPLVLGATVGLRFSEISEILWPILAIRIWLWRPPHSSLKKTTSILCWSCLISGQLL